MKREDYTEQVILQIAEEEFMEKGFHGAKTIIIARKAGVTLLTFHSYFKKKEDLFQIVFLRKVEMIAVSLLIYNEEFSFEDAIVDITKHHFDLVSQNPNLINFIYNEVMSNSKNRRLLLKILLTRLHTIYAKFEKMLSKEIAEGRIRPIKAIDLIMSMLSLNVFSFMTYSTVKDLMPNQPPEDSDTFLEERKKSNIQFILNALRP